MQVLPRFAPTPFRLFATPAPLQEALACEYAAMDFQPVREELERDPVYQADVISGISSLRSRTPDLHYAPMSEVLKQLAYEQLTPLIEAWAGQPLEPSGVMAFAVMAPGPGCTCTVIGSRPMW